MKIVSSVSKAMCYQIKPKLDKATSGTICRSSGIDVVAIDADV